MTNGEERGFARPDGRAPEAPEVIGSMSSSDDSTPGVAQWPANEPRNEAWPEPPTAVQPVVGATAPVPAGPVWAVPAPHGTVNTPPIYGEPAGSAPLHGEFAQADPSSTPPAQADPWGYPTTDPWVDVTPGAPTGAAPAVTTPGDSRGRRLGGAIGLFAAGAVVGALVTGIYTGWGENGGSTALTAQNSPAQGQPGGQAQQGQPNQPGAGQNGQGFGGQQGLGGGQGFGGGNTGEQRLVGTLTAVSGSKVTVKSASGTATYAIVADTEIVRNGAAATASALHVGDRVLVHVFPAANSDGVLERLIAQSPSSSGSGSGSGSDPSNQDDQGGATT